LDQKGKFLDSVTAIFLRGWGKPDICGAAAAAAVPRLEPGGRSRVRPRSYDVSGGLRMLISVLITFLVVILVLYLINLLPLDGRAKQIARVVVIILGVISLLKYIAIF
jgi:hypothetical protein